jgi:hypothetical protein
MDVRLDEARRDEAAFEIDFTSFRREPRLDRGDPPPVDADIERRAVAADDAGVAQNKIHGPLPVIAIPFRGRLVLRTYFKIGLSSRSTFPPTGKSVREPPALGARGLSRRTTSASLEGTTQHRELVWERIV